MTRQIQVRGPLGLQRALDAEQKRINAKLHTAARNAAEYGKTKAMQLSRAIGFRASGTYEKGFVTGVTVAGAYLANSAEHAGIIELGRRPGRRPPPVMIILQWMMEKGMIPKMPGLSQKSFVSRALKTMRSVVPDRASQKRIRGRVEEGARRQRLSEREQFIQFAWRRAWMIAKSIGVHGMKPHWVLGRTTADINRFLRTEIRKIARGE